jgi:predicted CXXCH cytochrome family protein
LFSEVVLRTALISKVAARSGLLGLVAASFAAAAAGAPRSGRQAGAILKGPGATNHPVGVRPSASVHIPEGWPLAADGTLTCTTCHQGLSRPDRGQLRAPVDPDNPQAFCGKCHNSDGNGLNLHWLAVPVAHLPGRTVRDSRKGASMDRAAQSCLACHDGVTASEAAYQPAGHLGPGGFADRGRNHPIGVNYPPAGTHRVEVPLRPASLLPENVLLPNGKVSCVSCHDPYATTAKQLTVPIEESRLCMTCHQMD